jgi:hypothetical protein
MKQGIVSDPYHYGKKTIKQGFEKKRFLWVGHGKVFVSQIEKGRPKTSPWSTPQCEQVKHNANHFIQ